MAFHDDNLKFIHSFIIHSVNPYKVDKPIGYKICHDTNIKGTK
jgi:hypothetical protein